MELQPWNGCWGIGGTPIVLANEVCISALFEETITYKEVKQIVENPPANVKFTGIVEREVMNELYNIADVMFLPSYNELFPMIILEAMNCNTPILLRDLDIYPKILFDFYLKGNSNEEFVEYLTALKENKQFRKERIQKSLEGSLFYSKENVLAMWQEFYNEILYTHKDVLVAGGGVAP